MIESLADLPEVAGLFETGGRLVEAVPYGRGHINDTYLATYAREVGTFRLIHQRINEAVFRDPEGLMENVERVTAHLGMKLAGRPDAERLALKLVPTKSGAAFAQDRLGGYWRSYRFVEGGVTFDTVDGPERAFEAGRAFGQFQAQLSDLPGPRLKDTIPNFHDSVKRIEALESAIETDACGRVSDAGPEIEFARKWRSLAGALLELHQAGVVSERVTHNDTKVNNLLFDENTGEALCVVDLDTVMPGLAPYDFGDLVRTAVSPAAEDERNLSLVEMRMPVYEALLRGYLKGTGSLLNSAEIECLTLAGKLITYTIGVRFLTDHIAGDRYFKVHREGHNLDRCRTQFRLAESIERKEHELTRLALRIAREA